MPKEQESNDFQLDSKQHFNSQDSQTFIFKQQDFLDFLKLRILDKSYTKFANKIGLSVNNELLKADSRVVLNFPYKDCVLKGGQSRDDEKSKEIFFNEILARDEIDVLFAPKVLHNFEFISNLALSKFCQSNEEIKNIFNINTPPNLLIKGNNLIALHSLKNNPHIYGKVKLIYIDPPYNTGNDSFNYNDRFTHSAWLSFMKNRLEIAREFLRDDGVIFIQCDDNEQAYLKVLCDEIFGRENFVSTICWRKKTGGGQDSIYFAKEHEYILCYQKYEWKINDIKQEQDEKDFNKIINGKRAKILKLEKWGVGALRTDAPTLYYPIKDPNGEDFYPVAPNGVDGRWRKKPENLDSEHIFWQKDSKGRLTPYEVIYFDEVKDNDKILKTRTIWLENGNTTQSTSEIKALFLESRPLRGAEIVDKGGSSASARLELEADKRGSPLDCQKSDVFFGAKGSGDGINPFLQKEINKDISALPQYDKQTKLFATPKPEALLKRIIEISTKEGDLVMDFFAGSGTTLAVAHKMNRKWVGVEQMDYIETITKARLEKVIAGEQGGVSKVLGWKGGGEFVYCELMPLNAVYKEQILNTKNQEELESLYKDLQTKAFLDYRVDLAEVLKDKDFKDLDLESKKFFLIQALDSNMDYVPLGDIKDSTYNVSSEVIALNKAFYGE